VLKREALSQPKSDELYFELNYDQPKDMMAVQVVQEDSIKGIMTIKASWGFVEDLKSVHCKNA
jgi:hypothetical protein